MKIEIASRSDIPTMMRIERGDGYARLVGRWDVEQHAAAIENKSCRYYLARDEADIGMESSGIADGVQGVTAAGSGLQTHLSACLSDFRKGGSMCNDSRRRRKFVASKR